MISRLGLGKATQIRMLLKFGHQRTLGVDFTLEKLALVDFDGFWRLETRILIYSDDL